MYVWREGIFEFSRYMLPFVWILVFQIMIFLADVWFIFYFEPGIGSEYEQHIIAKILMVCSGQIIWNYLVCQTTDIGISDWSYGTAFRFLVPLYAKASIGLMGICVGITLPYTSLLLDSDIQKEGRAGKSTYRDQPWFKAIIWNIIVALLIVLVMTLLYYIVASGSRVGVVCEDGSFYKGSGLCNPQCLTYWDVDPTICMAYVTQDGFRSQPTIPVLLTTVHVVCGLIVTFFFPIGLLSIVLLHIHSIKQMNLPRLSATSLQVRKSDYADVVKAMLILGTSIRKRSLRFRAPFSLCSYQSWKRKIKQTMHLNKFHRAVHLFLFELDDLERQSVPVNFWYKLWRWLVLSFSVSVALLLVLVATIYRVLPTFNIMSRVFGTSIVSSLMRKWVLDGRSTNMTSAFLFPVLVGWVFLLTMALCYITFRGYVTLCNYILIIQPMQMPRRRKTNIRDLNKLLCVCAIVVMSLPYYTGLYIEDIQTGTWSNRNSYSLLEQMFVKIRNNAVGEFLGLAVFLTALICIAIRPYHTCPFGIGVNNASQKDVLSHANKIVARWKEDGKDRRKQINLEQAVNNASPQNIAKLAAQFK